MKASIRSLGLVAFLLSASSAYAIPIGTVGAIDTVLASANLANSGQATEAAWIAGILGVPVNTINYTQLTGSDGSAWQQVTGGPAGTDLWAFDFLAAGVTDPAVFLVKLGNTTFSHYLYTNLASLQYGVIDLAALAAAHGNVTIFSVSHVGTAGGATSVPEPGTLSMLLAGLAGLGGAAYRRRVRR